MKSMNFFREYWIQHRNRQRCLMQPMSSNIMFNTLWHVLLTTNTVMGLGLKRMFKWKIYGKNTTESFQFFFVTTSEDCELTSSSLQFVKEIISTTFFPQSPCLAVMLKIWKEHELARTCNSKKRHQIEFIFFQVNQSGKRHS